ncbi:DUF4266 domain-containing protein [Pendulispora albinea]|uniref:DUF4266 domain-containing protein n=1 Tax=Pendulispora albinea TaxID=2741071 RepID=A0ABZ2MAZ4_9BACT
MKTGTRLPGPYVSLGGAHVLLLGACALLLGACATVKPQDRGQLADPIMQFEGDPQADSRVQHAVDNREGSHGGGGVSGGGCGCN